MFYIPFHILILLLASSLNYSAWDGRGGRFKMPCTSAEVPAGVTCRFMPAAPQPVTPRQGDVALSTAASVQLLPAGSSHPLLLHFHLVWVFYHFLWPCPAPSPSGRLTPEDRQPDPSPGSVWLYSLIIALSPNQISYLWENALYHTVCDSGYKFDERGVGGITY